MVHVALSGCCASHVREARQKSKSLFHGQRFPAEVISRAVRWYLRFQLRFRDIEELNRTSNGSVRT